MYVPEYFGDLKGKHLKLSKTHIDIFERNSINYSKLVRALSKDYIKNMRLK